MTLNHHKTILPVCSHLSHVQPPPHSGVANVMLELLNQFCETVSERRREISFPSRRGRNLCLLSKLEGEGNIRSYVKASLVI